MESIEQTIINSLPYVYHDVAHLIAKFTTDEHNLTFKERVINFANVIIFKTSPFVEICLFIILIGTIVIVEIYIFDHIFDYIFDHIAIIIRMILSKPAYCLGYG